MRHKVEGKDTRMGLRENYFIHTPAPLFSFILRKVLCSEFNKGEA